MITEIPINESHIYALQLSGKLVEEDYRIFRPKLERILKKESPISLLIKLKDFEGWSAKAAWQDLKMGLEHNEDFLRIAIVGESLLERIISEVGDLFTKSEIEHFKEETAALKWLKEVENLAEQDEYIGYRHILVATDFSKYADMALKKAIEISKPFNSKVTLIHAAETFSADLYPSIGELAVPVLVDNPEQEKKHLQRIEKQLDDFLEKLGYKDTSIETTVVTGHPVDALVEYATKNNVDLIVMGSHGRRGLARLIGSATNGVINHALCDVLTVV